MSQKNFDEEILRMIKADEIRAGLVPGARKSIYLIEEPWIMTPEPFRVQWIDPLRDEVCLIHILDLMGEGDKYAMFLVYEEQNERVINYVFEKEKYEASNASTVD